MQKLLLVFSNSLRRMLSFNAAALACGILLVVLYPVFVGVFTGANGISAISIGFNDADNSVASQAVEQYCTDTLGLDLEQSNNQSHLDSLLLNKDISVVVEVPQGFEQALLEGAPLPLKVTFMQDYENQAFLSGYLNSYTSSLQQLAYGAQGSAASFEELIAAASNQVVPLTTIVQDSQQSQRETQLAIRDVLLGFFLMFSFLLGIGLARLMAEDRQQKTYARIKLTSVRSISYIAGLCLAGLVSSIGLLLPLLLFWQIQGLGALFHVAWLAVLGILYMLFVIGISLIVGLFFNTQSAMVTVMVAFDTLLCMLGGAYWPVNIMPDIMQQIAHFTPPYWFMEAVNSLDAANLNTSQLWVGAASTASENTLLFSVIILSLFALLCYLVAAIRFALRENS
ncbi:hypothetical protein FACS1894104_4030 [Actinomycetota bacterium]|nr:hypothetical protein FACS1894104_4030 [Actinomycetota bacterium]